MCSVINTMLTYMDTLYICMCRCVDVMCTPSLSQIALTHFTQEYGKNQTLSSMKKHLNSVLQFGRTGLCALLAILAYLHLHFSIYFLVYIY